MPAEETSIRPARAEDADAIARIYRQGIEERAATFQTQTPSADEIATQIAAGRLMVVAEAGGHVVGWASVGPTNRISPASTLRTMPRSPATSPAQ